LIGADMGNADWMVVAPDVAARLTPDLLTGLLARAAAEVGGIDLISLFDQPAEWNGIANPLLGFAHQPGPDHLHLGTIDANGSFDRFDDKRRANLKRRARKLGEMMGGPVDLRAATSIAEIDRIHAVFLEHRAARFAQMGIANRSEER